MGKKLLASLPPLALLMFRLWAIGRCWADYNDFWNGGGPDWLGMPFPYGLTVLPVFLAIHLAARWLPLLAPLGTGAAPWLPPRPRRWTYLGCTLAWGAAFLGEGFLYLVNAVALDSRGHIGEMPLADLAGLVWCVAALCRTDRRDRRVR